MNLPQLSATQALLVLLAGMAASAGCDAQDMDSREGSPLIPIDDSVYLGQIYPSGLLYLESFRSRGEASALGDWPTVVRFMPMDQEASSAIPPSSQSATARFLRIEQDVNPPEVERLLRADSPCVPEGYRPSEASTYVGGDARPVIWEPAEYFATNEWFGCWREPTVAVYEVEGEIEASFRIVAFRPELALVRPEWHDAGTPRPLTSEEAERVAERIARDGECPLQPRGLEEARKLLGFALKDTRYRIRLSSHVAACTSLGEVFILDVLEGEDLLESHGIVRWRGDP